MSRNYLHPCGLTVEQLTRPLALDTRHPRFAWRFDPKRGHGRRPVAFQVVVAQRQETVAAGRGDLWDSGRVATPDCSQAEYAGAPLVSSTRLWWSVRVWDEAGGDAGFCQPDWFETGRLPGDDWGAAWIGAPAEGVSAAPLLRQTFYLEDAPVIRARAYVCGLGYYELRLNGEKVGDAVLAPAWTDYGPREFRKLLYPFDPSMQRGHRALYNALDVTAVLHAGANALGVILGNGWFNQRQRTVEGELWYGPPRLRLRLEVEYANGRRQTVVSDPTWRCAAGSILENQLFGGETCDARRDLPGWDRSGFADHEWGAARELPPPGGQLLAQMAPADKIQALLPPKAIRPAGAGTFILDYGQVFSGWVRLTVRGAAGDCIRLRFAEEVTVAGELDFASAGGTEQIQQDQFILSGAAAGETWEPRFVWHAFRYAEITGWPAATLLPPQAVGCVVHTALEAAPEFHCAAPELDELCRVWRRTYLANLHGAVPTDCPHRERLGYTGDGQLTAAAALLHFNAPNLYRKWLQDIADAQNATSGFVPHTAPFNGGGGGPWWGAALVLVTRDLWLHTADQRAVATHYVGCRAWVTYLQSRTDADGLVVNEEPGSWCLGDWILPGEPAPLPGTTALEPALVNTACLAVCARQVAAFARLLGQPAEATALDAVAAAAATALHRRFYDPVRACYAHGRNGAEAFAWAAGAIPPAEQPRVLERLLAHYTARHWRFDTGIIGTPLLLEMFAAWGRADLGWRFLRGTDYPSFGYMFANDATTLWECWEKETGSHCHPMFGAVCAWIIREVAGLRPDPAHPGWREFQVHLPCLPNLDAAAATVPTPHGEAHAAWRRREGGHHLRLSVPPGCTAWLTPPTGGPAIRCGGGDHEFAFPAANGPAQLG